VNKKQRLAMNNDFYGLYDQSQVSAPKQFLSELENTSKTDEKISSLPNLYNLNPAEEGAVDEINFEEATTTKTKFKKKKRQVNTFALCPRFIGFNPEYVMICEKNLFDKCLTKNDKHGRLPQQITPIEKTLEGKWPIFTDVEREKSGSFYLLMQVKNTDGLYKHTFTVKKDENTVFLTIQKSMGGKFFTF
jgi:hypothetical protein